VTETSTATEIKCFCRTFRSAQTFLVQKGILNEYGSAMCFLGALTKKLRRKVLRKVKVDFDEPNTVKINVLIEAVLEQAHALRNMEKCDALFCEGKFTVRTKEFPSGLEKTSTKPVTSGTQAAIPTVPVADTTATVTTVQRSEFDRLMSAFETLRLTLMAQQNAQAQNHMLPMPAVPMYPSHQFTAPGPASQPVGVASQQMYGYESNRAWDARGYQPGPPWNGRQGQGQMPTRAPYCFYCSEPGHMRRACPGLAEDTSKGLVHEGPDYKLYHGPPGPSARFVNNRGFRGPLRDLILSAPEARLNAHAHK
jgi:hypothetical protein